MITRNATERGITATSEVAASPIRAACDATTIASVAIMSGTIAVSPADSSTRAGRHRRAANWVAIAAASGIASITTNARANGPGSIASAMSPPTNSPRNSGSASIWASRRIGAAASKRSWAPPASAVNTMT